MTTKLLALDTHPIQYRAPIFREIERLRPGELQVAYASDFSVRGYADPGFGGVIAWDVPLLDGYRSRALDNHRPNAGREWNRFSGRAVGDLIRTVRPRAVLLNTFGNAFAAAAYAAAVRDRIPVWLRIETQDQAFERLPLKRWMRSAVYRAAYSGISRAFYIGELNRRHLLAHGVHEDRLRPARYCTPDPLAEATTQERRRRRTARRAALGLDEEVRLIGFFGKLIPKKDPALLLDAVQRLPNAQRLAVMLVGSGELEADLRARAEAMSAAGGSRVIFAGFVNQSKIADYYLATDVAVMPSRRMGETWGLVANEALQAGCSVVVSDAVGCHADFAGLERFRSFPVGDAAALAGAIDALASFERHFDWARPHLEPYSISASAAAICDELARLDER